MVAADTTKRRQTTANDDISQDERLELWRLLVEIRHCEQRAYDLFLQNLVKGTSHLSLGRLIGAEDLPIANPY